MQIEIQGQDAIKVAQIILAMDGVQGSYEVVSEVERDEKTITTILSIIALTTAPITITNQIYELKDNLVNSPNTCKIERVLFVGKNGGRLLLKDATLEQLQKLLEKEKS